MCVQWHSQQFQRVHVCMGTYCSPVIQISTRKLIKNSTFLWKIFISPSICDNRSSRDQYTSYKTQCSKLVFEIQCSKNNLVFERGHMIRIREDTLSFLVTAARSRRNDIPLMPAEEMNWREAEKLKPLQWTLPWWTQCNVTTTRSLNIGAGVTFHVFTLCRRFLQ